MEILRTGRVVGVVGNMVTVEFKEHVIQNEVAYVVVGSDVSVGTPTSSDNSLRERRSKERLKSEVIRVKGQQADIQVFEDTRGICIGDKVEFSNELLSVELGPGLLAQVFDGLQNPLPELAKQYGFFLKRGAYLTALPDQQEWVFTPTVKVGDKLRAGEKLGIVPEKIFQHWIMVPFNLSSELEVIEIVGKGNYPAANTIAKLKDSQGRIHGITMKQIWPVKIPIKAYSQKLKPTEPLVTKLRIIDTLVPVAVGGTFCTPGPFGAGKTVLQHLLSRHAQVDIVVVAACGEREISCARSVSPTPPTPAAIPAPSAT